ncbi:pantoate--beta-alanine ligase [Amphritea sp. HPY]|uniref:pantoate--beta-alanine ligase n=1 Tax=Amphritea sp. HPY TaxID=3421652 RepID=UPI003D7DEF50
MQALNLTDDLRSRLNKARAGGLKIGFVPTMGNLHDGHISLVEAARKECDVVVVSIFVNPLQFGINEDLDTYPRTLEDDKALLASHGCDILFSPSVREMYPDGKGIATIVDMPELSQLHCGISRPQFFKGVATVIVKLLCMVQPDIAYFGEKDRQQLTIVRQVINDLSIPVRITGVATKRAASGLALSSRNNYLSEEELQIAASLYQVLLDVCRQLQSGSQDYLRLESEASQKLATLGFVPDYFHICQQQSLLPVQPDDQNITILAAANLNGTRLIDNIAFDLCDLYSDFQPFNQQADLV